MVVGRARVDEVETGPNARSPDSWGRPRAICSGPPGAGGAVERPRVRAPAAATARGPGAVARATTEAAARIAEAATAGGRGTNGRTAGGPATAAPHRTPSTSSPVR